MSRDPSLYLEDILQAVARIRSYTSALTKQELLADDMRVDAVVRNLEVIGEAARHLPDEVRDRMPEVRWREIIGMRNILSHAYFSVDGDIVWDVIKWGLEPLEENARRYLGSGIRDTLE